MKLVIVDYGVGNIFSVVAAFKKIGVTVPIVSSESRHILSASHLILPGVGSYRVAMTNIKNLGLVEPLTQSIMERKTPVLGICLGMQLFCSHSTEGGSVRGLGFVNCSVTQIQGRVRLPHVGFDQIDFHDDSTLLKGISSGSDFYFSHSFSVNLESNLSFSATCSYGHRFTALFENQNIYACQFHPELSHQNGARLLKNFTEIGQ